MRGFMSDELHMSSGTSKAVCEMILRTPGSFPNMEQVAKDFHITSRTLRRRLETEGISYQEILADVRISLVIRYLRTTRMSTETIAQLTGFSDGANLRRALKRWTNKTTRDFRLLARSG